MFLNCSEFGSFVPWKLWPERMFFLVWGCTIWLTSITNGRRLTTINIHYTCTLHNTTYTITYKVGIRIYKKKHVPPLESKTNICEKNCSANLDCGTTFLTLISSAVPGSASTWLQFVNTPFIQGCSASILSFQYTNLDRHGCVTPPLLVLDIGEWWRLPWYRHFYIHICLLILVYGLYRGCGSCPITITRASNTHA